MGTGIAMPVMAMELETAIPSSAQHIEKINQAGHNDLPDLFKPVKIWIGFA